MSAPDADGREPREAALQRYRAALDAAPRFPAVAAGPPPDDGDIACERCGRTIPAASGTACSACEHIASQPPPSLEIRQQAAAAFAAGAWLTPPPPEDEGAPA